MTNGAICYFFSALDFHLTSGASPGEALQRTTEDYAFVYRTLGEGETHLARAARVALRRLEEYREEESP